MVNVEKEIQISDVVFIPGLNNTAKTWEGIIENLPSDFNYHTPNCPSLEDLDEIAEDLLEKLPERFHLCGFSFGGYVALAMLEKAPDRITGLALIGSLPYADTEKQKNARNAAIHRAKSGEYEEMVLSQSHVVFHPDNLSNPKLEQLRKENIEEYGAERFIAHQKACINRPDRLHLLERMNIPFLMISGDSDVVVPTEQQQLLANKLENVKFDIIPTAGHMVPLESPAAVAEKLISWIKGD